jgi:lipopolysaccharide/colanic/teichoic acid biosynthesis glycosyltransferase
VIAVAVLVDSGRPVFFVQERVGRGGRTFRLFKFRTLRRDYDSRAGRGFMQAFVRGQVGHGPGHQGGRAYKPVSRADITRVGRLLRRTSLDELPQIINVLRRDMSLVGPRPNVQWEVDAYQDWHRERLKVLPGITGLAQVRGRSTISFDEIVRHDIEYIRNRSLTLDLRILWRTVLVVLGD